MGNYASKKDQSSFERSASKRWKKKQKPRNYYKAVSDLDSVQSVPVHLHYQSCDSMEEDLFAADSRTPCLIQLQQFARSEANGSFRRSQAYSKPSRPTSFDPKILLQNHAPSSVTPVNMTNDAIAVSKRSSFYNPRSTLPTPEQKMEMESSQHKTEIIKIDTSGEQFDRRVKLRRSQRSSVTTSRKKNQQKIRERHKTLTALPDNISHDLRFDSVRRPHSLHSDVVSRLSYFGEGSVISGESTFTPRRKQTSSNRTNSVKVSPDSPNRRIIQNRHSMPALKNVPLSLPPDTTDSLRQMDLNNSLPRNHLIFNTKDNNDWSKHNSLVPSEPIEPNLKQNSFMRQKVSKVEDRISSGFWSGSESCRHSTNSEILLQHQNIAHQVLSKKSTDDLSELSASTFSLNSQLSTLEHSVLSSSNVSLSRSDDTSHVGEADYTDSSVSTARSEQHTPRLLTFSTPAGAYNFFNPGHVEKETKLNHFPSPENLLILGNRRSNDGHIREHDNSEMAANYQDHDSSYSSGHDSTTLSNSLNTDDHLTFTSNTAQYVDTDHATATSPLRDGINNNQDPVEISCSNDELYVKQLDEKPSIQDQYFNSQPSAIPESPQWHQEAKTNKRQNKPPCPRRTSSLKSPRYFEMREAPLCTESPFDPIRYTQQDAHSSGLDNLLNQGSDQNKDLQVSDFMENCDLSTQNFPKLDSNCMMPATNLETVKICTAPTLPSNQAIELLQTKDHPCTTTEDSEEKTRHPNSTETSNLPCTTLSKSDSYNSSASLNKVENNQLISIITKTAVSIETNEPDLGLKNSATNCEKQSFPPSPTCSLNAEMPLLSTDENVDVKDTLQADRNKQSVMMNASEQGCISPPSNTFREPNVSKGDSDVEAQLLSKDCKLTKDIAKPVIAHVAFKPKSDVPEMTKGDSPVEINQNEANDKRSRPALIKPKVPAKPCKSLKKHQSKSKPTILPKPVIFPKRHSHESKSKQANRDSFEVNITAKKVKDATANARAAFFGVPSPVADIKGSEEETCVSVKESEIVHERLTVQEIDIDAVNQSGNKGKVEEDFQKTTLFTFDAYAVAEFIEESVLSSESVEKSTKDYTCATASENMSKSESENRTMIKIPTTPTKTSENVKAAGTTCDVGNDTAGTMELDDNNSSQSSLAAEKDVFNGDEVTAERILTPPSPSMNSSDYMSSLHRLRGSRLHHAAERSGHDGAATSKSIFERRSNDSYRTSSLGRRSRPSSGSTSTKDFKALLLLSSCKSRSESKMSAKEKLQLSLQDAKNGRKVDGLSIEGEERPDTPRQRMVSTGDIRKAMSKSKQERRQNRTTDNRNSYCGSNSYSSKNCPPVSLRGRYHKRSQTPTRLMMSISEDAEYESTQEKKEKLRSASVSNL